MWCTHEQDRSFTSFDVFVEARTPVVTLSLIPNSSTCSASFESWAACASDVPDSSTTTLPWTSSWTFFDVSMPAFFASFSFLAASLFNLLADTEDMLRMDVIVVALVMLVLMVVMMSAGKKTVKNWMNFHKVQSRWGRWGWRLLVPLLRLTGLGPCPILPSALESVFVTLCFFLLRLPLYAPLGAWPLFFLFLFLFLVTEVLKGLLLLLLLLLSRVVCGVLLVLMSLCLRTRLCFRS